MRARLVNKWQFSSRLALHSFLTPIERVRWAQANVSIVCVLAVTPIFLSLIALLTDWDLALADAAFDFGLNAFPLRHAWLTEVFNHVILKGLFIVIALGFLITVLWDLISPRSWSWLRRFQFRVVALSAILVPTVISILKQISHSHCPWDIRRYGGTEPYVRLFEYLPVGIEPGRCMPAGHASSALWMISFSIFFIPHRLMRAATVLVALLAVGFSVGWLQQLRGAHFLTHTLWSLWVALATVFFVTNCLDRWPVRQSINRS
jgi:membrane-associated PAP2 superfamily phosphatase